MGETPSSSQTLTNYPLIPKDNEVNKYINSLTFHGYEWGASNNLTKLHDQFPKYPIWQTEIRYAKVGNPMVWNNLPKNGPTKLPVYNF